VDMAERRAVTGGVRRVVGVVPTARALFSRDMGGAGDEVEERGGRGEPGDGMEPSSGDLPASCASDRDAPRPRNEPKPAEAGDSRWAALAGATASVAAAQLPMGRRLCAAAFPECMLLSHLPQRFPKSSFAHSSQRVVAGAASHRSHDGIGEERALQGDNTAAAPVSGGTRQAVQASRVRLKQHEHTRESCFSAGTGVSAAGVHYFLAFSAE